MTDPASNIADQRRWPLVVFALFVVAGIIAAWLWRWPTLSSKPLWIDEVFTWQDIQNNIQTMVGWAHQTTHPPLMYMLVKTTTRLLGGEEEWQMRLTSYVVWLATTFAGFLLGRQMHSTLVGLCLALVISLDPVMANQGTEARMHMLGLFFTLLSIAWAGRLLHRGETRVLPWMGLGLLLTGIFWSTASGLYLVPTIVVVMAIGVWRTPPCAVEGRPRRGWQGLILAVLFWMALCHVGLMRLAIKQKSSIPDDRLAGTWGDALHLIAEFPGMIVPMPVAAISYAVVALGVVGLLVMVVQRRPAAWVALAVVLVNVAACALLAKVHHSMYPRYFLPAGALLWLGLAGLGVELFRRQRAAAVLLPAAVGVLIWSALTWVPMRDNVGGRLREIAEVIRPGEVVVMYPDWFFLEADYYAPEMPKVLARTFEPYDATDTPDTPLDEAPQGVWLVGGFVGEGLQHPQAQQWVDEYRAIGDQLARRYPFAFPVGSADVYSRVTLYSTDADRFDTSSDSTPVEEDEDVTD